MGHQKSFIRCKCKRFTMAIKNKLKAESITTFYQYQAGTGILHRIPSWIKLISLFICSFATLYVPVLVCIPLFFIICLCAKKCGIAIRIILKDLIPVLYYAMLLYITSVISLKTFIPQSKDLYFCIRISLMLQLASILFRTTTSIELKDGITLIEKKIRIFFHLSPKATIAQSFSFFLLFLPQTFLIWDAICRAWKARGGKNNVKKIVVLLPILISLNMHKAWQTAKAIAARE